MLEVVAAYIRQNEKVLLCQRPENKKRALGWEFPGGKVEPGETKQAALQRECREELDIEVRVCDEIADVTYSYPDVEIHLTLLEAFIQAGKPTALEHKTLRWVSPEQMTEYELCPADRLLINQFRL